MVYRRSLVLLLLLAASPAPRAEASGAAAQEIVAPADSVRALIPVGTLRVAVMDMVAPPRLQQLTQQFQAAAQRDPAWWTEYVRANARPGEPLPYHAKLGISEDEYREMLSLFGQIRLAPVGEAELTVRTEGSGRYVLDGGTTLPELTGIVVDLEQNRVETPFGATTSSNPIEATPEQKATGPWKGFSWKREDVDEATMTGTVIDFNVGRLQESGRGILYYDAKRVANGSMQARASRVLTYELPAR